MSPPSKLNKHPPCPALGGDLDLFSPAQKLGMTGLLISAEHSTELMVKMVQYTLYRDYPGIISGFHRV
jgi:hypothetical protein